MNNGHGMEMRGNVSCPLFAQRLYSNPSFVPHYIIELQLCLFEILSLMLFTKLFYEYYKSYINSYQGISWASI